MHKILKIAALLCITPLFLFAQIIPQEGSALNYRIVGFSVLPAPQINTYELQVALGNYISEKDFQKNIVVKTTAKENKIIAEVPAFGKQYTWCVVYTFNGGKTTKSELHHFSTLTAPCVDPDSVHLRVIDAATKYNDDYVFVDGNKTLYDMSGAPVWFLPAKAGLGGGLGHLRDLKLTPFGTITTIVDERIYELGYNGDILWQGPGNSVVKTDSASFDNSYHHEFTRRPNGHYMVMAFEQPWWQLPGPVDSATYAYLGDKIRRDNNNNYYQKMFFGTLIEYDAQGKVVWKWNSSDYFKTSDLYARMTPNKLFGLNDTHENAFYFDEKTQTILISFRDINRIIKIQYPSGKVLAQYGKLYTPGTDPDRPLINGMYCGQHGCRLSAEGYLYLFNNNSCRRKALPTVELLKMPQSEKDTLQKVWEFECPMDVPGEKPGSAAIFNFGGNVIELPGSELFVCMGGLYGKVFIVNRDKKILWSAQPEKWDNNMSAWTKHGMLMDSRNTEGIYRSSIITRKQLESLIWQEPLKN